MPRHTASSAATVKPQATSARWSGDCRRSRRRSAATSDPNLAPCGLTCRRRAGRSGSVCIRPRLPARSAGNPRSASRVRGGSPTARERPAAARPRVPRTPRGRAPRGRNRISHFSSIATSLRRPPSRQKDRDNARIAGRGAANHQVPLSADDPTPDDVSSQDVEHLLVGGQRPQVIGHNAFQRVGGGANRVHRRQQRLLRVRGLGERRLRRVVGQRRLQLRQPRLQVGDRSRNRFQRSRARAPRRLSSSAATFWASSVW